MPSINHKTAIILAGGLSTRMGFNKELIQMDNDYVVYRQIDTLKTLFDEIIIVSNNIDFYTGKDVKVVQDLIPKKSPLVGLYTGLTASSNHMNYLLACDMPYMDLSFINEMIFQLQDKEAVVVSNNGFFEPFNALYTKQIASKLQAFLESNLKFQDFIKTLDTTIITDTSSFDERMFLNLNTPYDLYKHTIDDKTYQEITIKKYRGNEDKDVTDYVIQEFPITLYINHQKYITMLITPTNINELIVGYLKSEKIITSKDDIKSIDINETAYTAHIELFNKEPLLDSNKDKILSSGCGVGTRFHEDLDAVIMDAIESDYTISTQEIIDASERLNSKSGLFKLTGGVHSCIFTYNDADVYFEDIGRHNAVDKVVGYIELNDISTTHSYLMSSGRISSDMLLKCSISKIPIVLSRSAPTSLAILLAQKYGITLVGFVRGTRFNVYSNPHRIVR